MNLYDCHESVSLIVLLLLYCITIKGKYQMLRVTIMQNYGRAGGVLNSYKKIAFNNLMCFCIFISPFLLELATAGNIVIRSLFSYPLTLAFMAVVELNWMRAFFSDEKKAVFQVISFCLVAAAAGKEMTVTSRLLYTDNKTMEEDYEALGRIYYTALQQGAREGDAFCFVGWKDQPRGDKITYMEDEVIGYSYLETIPLTKNEKIIDAMTAFGFNVSYPTEEQETEA